MWAKAVNSPTTQAVERAKPTLEEDLELSNVTELRQNLLPVIERMEKNPALRIIVLKHGKPQAVLMSAATYDLVKRLMNQLASQAEAMPRRAAIESAITRLRSERTSARPDQAVAVAGLSIQDISHQIETLVSTLLTLKNNLTPKAESDQAGS